MSLGRRRRFKSKIIGVIMTETDLDRAVRMRKPPDLFELRLDSLYSLTEDIRRRVTKLRAPLVITARHPAEGGLNELRPRTRLELLRSFLPQAAYVDVELRSARGFAPFLEEAKARKLQVIISFHDLRDTPSVHRLYQIALDALSFRADIVKIATLTEGPEQLGRLTEFFLKARRHIRIAAMGIGHQGRISRIEFAKHGSALSYAHLGGSKVGGQLSIAELNRIIR